MNTEKYQLIFITISSYLFLYLMEAYQAMLFLTIAYGFIYFVMKSKKFKFLTDSIERFF